MSDKSSGPAFPQLSIDRVDHHPDHGTHAGMVIMSGGMSLRDYFAAAALTGLMSDMGLRPSNEAELAEASRRLYQFADAMLAEREKS